jgi:CHAT domain-containing protein
MEVARRFSRQAEGQSTSPFYWAAFVAAGDWN